MIKDSREPMLQYKEIFLGNQCNNKCLYCLYRQKDLSPPDFKTVTESLIPGKEDGIALYGGEPTLRYDLVEIIRTAKKNGCRRIKLITNGRTLSNSQVLQQIISAGCNLFEIKLWGSNPDLHDYLTQTPDSFWQVIQGIENLRQLACDKFICLRIFLCKQNYTDTLNMITAGINFGVHRIILSIQDHNLALKELIPNVQMAIQVSILNRIWILTEGLPFCVMQGLEHHIGEIYYKHDNAMNLSTYKQHNHCKNCVYEEICPGVEAEYFNHFGHGEFTPVRGSKYLQDMRVLYG
jgi:wyosine [tRNA(Phe)-imidazoG37] synthetase (radical SAM superfamily)